MKIHFSIQKIAYRDFSRASNLALAPYHIRALNFWFISQARTCNSYIRYIMDVKLKRILPTNYI